MSQKWAPESWTRKPALQQPAYPDPSDAEKVVKQIACLPPLVTSWEVRALKAQLAEACTSASISCSRAAIVPKASTCATPRPLLISSKFYCR